MHLRKHHVDNLRVSVFVLPFALRNLSVFPFMSNNVARLYLWQFYRCSLIFIRDVIPNSDTHAYPNAAPSLSHRVPVILLLLTPRSFNIFLSTSFGSLKWSLFKVYSTLIILFPSCWLSVLSPMRNILPFKEIYDNSWENALLDALQDG